MSSVPPAGEKRRSRRLARLGARALAIAAGGLLIGLLVYGVAAQSPNTRIEDSLARGVAVSAPSFKLAVLQHGSLGPKLTPALEPRLRAGRLTPRNLRGTPLVLNIWASWCDPCRQEAPLLERVWRSTGRPRGVLFLGLDMQDATVDALDFLHRFGVDYANIRDPTNDVARRYGATGVPETFFIDSRGMIVGHVIGVITSAQLRDGIAAALNGSVVGSRQGGARRSDR